MALRFIETLDPFNLVTFECNEPYTDLIFRKPSVDTSINPQLVTRCAMVQLFAASWFKHSEHRQSQNSKSQPPKLDHFLVTLPCEA